MLTLSGCMTDVGYIMDWHSFCTSTSVHNNEHIFRFRCYFIWSYNYVSWLDDLERSNIFPFNLDSSCLNHQWPWKVKPDGSSVDHWWPWKLLDLGPWCWPWNNIYWPLMTLSERSGIVLELQCCLKVKFGRLLLMTLKSQTQHDLSWPSIYLYHEDQNWWLYRISW